jgi:23S rRNA-/tRNA-specific pseudouridylate synthase
MKVSCLLFILVLLRGSHSFHKCPVSKPGITKPSLPLVGPSYASFIDEVDLGAVNSGLGSETLLYADDDIIVMNKAPNSQTAPGYTTKESLAGSVAREYNIERVDQMIVHRLDHGTSGIVVFARNVEALRDLHAQFRTKHV